MGKIYENYHLDRRVQKRVIGDDDFTYGQAIKYFQKYGIKGSKVLDVGCGVGTIDIYLAKKGAHVLGIDVSKRGIDMAKVNQKYLKINKNLKFKVIDFSKSAPTGLFNKILCSEVLEHIKYDKKAVVKMKGLLKKNGILIASSPLTEAPLHRLGLLKGFDRKVGHLRRYSKESYAKMFKDAGFEILETEKTEGILRNFLFTYAFGGFLLKILNIFRFFNIVTSIDKFTIKMFGASNIYLIAQKI